MENRGQYVNSMMFFLAGGLAGAGAALLLAPQSGQVTRQKMSQRLRDTTDAAREMKDRVIQEGRDMKDRVLQESAEIRDQATTRVREAASVLAGRGQNRDASS